MSDRVGALHVPLEAADATDKALAVLNEFFRVFLNAKGQAGWSAVRPPKIAGAPAGGELLVNQIFTHDPELYSFNEKDLPALFLVRESGKSEWIAEDYRVSTSKLKLLWVFQPAPQAQRRVRSDITNAIAALLDVVISRYRDPVWVIAADQAIANAFKLSVASATTAQSYSAAGLDGVVGPRPLISPRHVTIATSVAAAAYSLAAPIVFEGLNEAGDVITESLALTAAGGGEVVEGTTLFARLTNISVPAQLLTTGAFQFGHAADAHALDEGSLLLLHAGLMSLALISWRDRVLAIRMDDGAPTRTYEAFEVNFECEERWTLDLDEDFDALDGIDVDITREDGSLFEQARLDS